MAYSILNRGSTGVAKGSVILFSAFENEGPMWVGQGPREERRRVEYGLTFLVPPMVHVGLSMWDVSNEANMRMQVAAEEVGNSGFVVSLRTWGDTRIARMGVSWLAVGMVTDPDLWDV